MSSGLVRILLSTWNSERFIRPLLDSIMAQDYAPLELVVRDDGSADGTPAILSEYSARFPDRIVYVPEPRGNLGVAGSCFTLIREYAKGPEYLAFADHDDIWDRDKVSCAVEMLRGRGPGPTLYTGRLRIMDGTEGPRRLSRPPERPIGFRNALVENVASGCTMMVNASARDLLLETRDLRGVKWPDLWFYLVISGFGHVIYDSSPHVDYRRHAANSVGLLSGWRHWQSTWQRFASGRLVNDLLGQADALRRNYGERLPPENRRVLEEFLARPSSFFARIGHAMSIDVYRQRLPDELVLRTILALSAGSPS